MSSRPGELEIARAWHLLDQDRVDEAESVLRELLGRHADHPLGLAMLTGLLLHSGRTEEAGTTAGRLIETHPDDPAGYQLLAWQHEGAGRLAEAEAPLRRSLALDPGSAASRRLLARLLQRLPGGAAEAEQELGRKLAQDPDDSQTVLQLVSVLAGHGRWDQAQNGCLAAIARCPARPEYRVALFSVLVARERFDEIRAELLDAVNERPPGYPFDHVLVLLELMGIPAELDDLYPVICRAAGWPDLTDPGAAGGERALLQRQAELATRLWEGGLPDDTGGEALPSPPDERVRSLVDAILAADPANVPARGLWAHILWSEERRDEALSVVRDLLSEGHQPPPGFEISGLAMNSDRT